MNKKGERASWPREMGGSAGVDTTLEIAYSGITICYGLQHEQNYKAATLPT